MEEEIRINETHVCVLKKREYEIYAEKMELRFKYQDILNKLDCMYQNPNRNIFELVDFVNTTDLSKLLSSFCFCKYLSGSYQYVYAYSPITREEYNNRLDVFDVEILKAKDEKKKEIIKGKEEYKIEIKKQFYEEIRSRVLPFMLFEMYKKIKQDDLVLAYSHRMPGWSAPEFKLSNDLDVIYKTNFGYGNSSYFYTNIRYKGIDILPYSDWIKYYKSDKEEIIRYTRKHELQNNEWLNSMEFTAELYNSYAKSPSSSFVSNWIMNEVVEMVDGLENILNPKNKYIELRKGFNSNIDITLMGRDVVRFRGEKSAGALTFLDKLRKLKELCDDINFYIERIVNFNLLMHPQLIKEIGLMNKELTELEDKLNELMPCYNEYENRNKEYQKQRDEICKLIIEEYNKESYDVIMQHVNDKINYLFPEYKSFKEKHAQIVDTYQSLNRNISSLNNKLVEFNGYSDEIEKYFSIVGRSSELIAS